MLNQFVVVGKIQTFKTLKDGGMLILLTVPRSYKNSEGEYDNDIIPVTIRGSIAENTSKYCAQGDMLGIKGAVQSTLKDNTYTLAILAEKVTFLSSKDAPKEDEENEI